MGRPTKYKSQYCNALVGFFNGPRTEERISAIVTGKNDYEKTIYETVALPLPTFAKFARSIGVNGDTLVEWSKKHDDFSAAYNAAKELQKEFLIDNGLAGHYPPASFIFTAKNITEMRDKQEVEHSGSVSLTRLFDEGQQ